jgi:hypothetical protein
VGSGPIGDVAGSGRSAAFGEPVDGAEMSGDGTATAKADLLPQQTANDPLAGGHADAAGEFSGRYREITSKLRELGAAYHRLETWEGETTVYRFQCALSANPAADGGDEYQTFEATGRQPTDAMERVLADVRAWRNGALY